MKLAPETIPALLRVVRESFADNADVWLFGSRTDDSKRGGDIDLYIETDIQHDIVTRRSDLRRRLEAIYGDRKIDLAIRPRSRAAHPYYQNQLGWRPDDTPNATSIGRETLSLPLSPSSTTRDVHEVIEAVSTIFRDTKI